MKAHIPLKTRLSKSTRKAARDYVDSYQHDQVRRQLKIACVALHNGKSKFGPQMLYQFIKDFSDTAEEKQRDEIFWHHIDTLLIDKLGLPFEREKLDLGLEDKD